MMKEIKKLFFVTGILACALQAAAGQLTVNVDAGTDVNIADAVDVGQLISSGEDLVKTGGGRLIIDKSLKGYKGEIRVEEGYLLALHNEAFGDTDKGTIISNGATLEFKDDSANGVLKFGKEQITVSGIGVNGCGALCHVGRVKSQWCAVFERVKLAGDTRFGGIPYNSNGECKRWDIRGGQGTFDMQGYNLEIKCNFGIAGADVVNPGNITVSGAKSQFCLEGSNARLNGSAENTLTIGEGTVLSSQSFRPALKWSVVIDGATLLEQNSTGDYRNITRIDGPVTVTEKGAKFQTFNAGGHWSFGGSVTVNGEISAVGTAQVNVVTLAGADDVEEKIADYLAMRSKAKASQLDSSLMMLFSAVPGQDGKAPAYAQDIAGVNFRLHLEPQTEIELTGNQDGAIYRQTDGRAKISGADKIHRFGDLALSGNASLDLTDAGTVDIHTNALSIGGKYPAVAKIRIAGGTLLTTNWADRAKGGSRNIHIGPVRNMSNRDYAVSDMFGGRGILEICDGAVVSNIFNIGRVINGSVQERDYLCHGSLFVRGGSVVMLGAQGEYEYNRIGSSGSAYVEVSGGTVDARDFIYPACGERGRAVWHQKGGYTHIDSSTPGFVWGQFSRTANPSKGVYYQTGGRTVCDEPLVFGKTLYDTSNSGNQDQFTMAGGEMRVNHGVDLAGAPDAKTIFNLNGGRFGAMFVQVITNENQTCIGTGKDKAHAGTYAWINLNGGCFEYVHMTGKGVRTDLEAYKAKSFFYGHPERMRITAYAGGAVFDTAGHDRNLDHTIASPSGNGLVSLSLPDGVEIGDWMFVGAPHIEISGDGSGASAVAEFDSENGRVTGFTVTSPGNGYTEISAKLTHGGYTNEIALACTLGKVVSGGLVKKGAGVLNMNAANTYGGATRVEGGTLRAVHADAIPPGNGLEIAGGTLDAGGFEKSYGSISAASGTLQNAAGTFSSFVKTGEGAFMFNAPLSGSAPLEVREGTLRLPIAVPGLLCGEKVYQEGEARSEYNNAVALSGLGVELTPSRAYELTSGGFFQPYHYVSYSGYAWNRSSTNETWTFAYAFDDSLQIIVNGMKLQGVAQSSASWGALKLAKATLSPGANSILIQLWNGPDAGGAVSHGLVSGCVNWTADHTGIVFNRNGGDSTNGLDYVRMADPGDGSLFTVHPYDGSTIPEFSSLEMWPGTELDACGGIYAFGKELKVTEDVFADPIQVLGGIAFIAGAKVDVADIEMLDRNQGAYTILETTHGVSGALPELDGAWRLRVSGDGMKLELLPRRGSAVVIR